MRGTLTLLKSGRTCQDSRAWAAWAQRLADGAAMSHSATAGSWGLPNW
jgi:hypothetical protein